MMGDGDDDWGPGCRGIIALLAVFARLMAESKRERILAAAERWPSLQPAAVAIIAGASPSYVSEVLSGALD